MLDLFFQGRSVAFESSLPVEQVTHRLEQEITPPASPLFDRRPQLFQGSFADGRFQMMRIVKGRNSFNPVIRGQVLRAAGRTRIDAQLQVHPLVIGFLAIFTVIAGRIASIAAPELLHMPGAGVFAGLLSMLLLITLFAAIANVEASKTTKMLSGVLGTQPVKRG